MLKKLNFLLLMITLSCVNASNLNSINNNSVINPLNQQLNTNINNVTFPEFGLENNSINNLENQQQTNNEKKLTKKRFRKSKESKTENLENCQQTNNEKKLTKKRFIKSKESKIENLENCQQTNNKKKLMKKRFNVIKESKEEENKDKNTKKINKVNFSLDKNVLCKLIEYLSKPFEFNKEVDEKMELINKVSRANRQKLEQYNIHNKIDVVNILLPIRSNVKNFDENKLINNCDYNYSNEKSIEMSSLSYAYYFIKYLLIKYNEKSIWLNALMFNEKLLNNVEYYISKSILSKITEITNLQYNEQSGYLDREFLKTPKKYILKNDRTVIVFTKQNKTEELLYYSNIEILLKNLGVTITNMCDEDIENNNIKNNNNINFIDDKLKYNDINVLQSNVCSIEIIGTKNNIVLNNNKKIENNTINNNKLITINKNITLIDNIDDIEKYGSDSESYDINLLKTPEMELHFYKNQSSEKDQSENEEHINNNQINDNNVMVSKVVDFEIIMKTENNIILGNENILNHNNEGVLNNNNNNNTNNEFYLALENTKEKFYKLMDTIKNNSQNNIEEHENKMNVLNNIINNIPKSNYLNIEDYEQEYEQDKYEDNSLEYDYSNSNEKEDDYYL